jgi:SAM-dependent methyltransferase
VGSSVALEAGHIRIDEEPICPGCSEPVNRCLGEVARTQIFLCHCCGLAFTDRSVTSSYGHEEWYDWLKFTPETGEKYLRFQTDMFTRQLGILSRLVRGRDLLDVGAGLGIFAKVASKNGWRAICAEINPRAKKFGTEIYGLEYQDLDSIPQASMDVVRLSHVLEHVTEPLGFLARVRECLRPGGICVVLVPHYEPLNCVIKNLILKCLLGKHDFRGHIYSPQHVLGFTCVSLSGLFQHSGFVRFDVRSVSRGNRTYYPWVSDDVRLSAKEVVFELVNRVGNIFGRGSWLIGYFGKTNCLNK